MHNNNANNMGKMAQALKINADYIKKQIINNILN